MKIEVSNGEIVDKYTILEVKLNEIKDTDKLINVQKEYDSLTVPIQSMYTDVNPKNDKLSFLQNELLNINKTLWNIEDIIRSHEVEERFDSDFIELARSVYYVNDERALIKKQINELTGSKLTEEKSYQEYK
jgi:hypothetical protein|tara:strand:+ start:24 stop:419 length:396 start_codon:yes stop_codon:yes gene_type:complete